MNESSSPLTATMRIDLHCHTEASHDCRTPLAQVPGRCLERRLDVLAVTDHNQIWGALKLRELVAEGTDLTVIVGEEVSTREGELIGLFLHDKIPAGLSPEETVAAIRDQGGLVLLPHGFDPLKANRLKPSALERIADAIDIVEVFNARISRPSWNRAASTWALQHQRAVSAGSDAHLLAHIGDAWIEAPRRQIASPADLLTALTQGQVAGTWTHPALALMQKILHGVRYHPGPSQGKQ